MQKGDSIPELRVVPDRWLPHRYAGASEDFNPIHIDPEFAREAGLPGNILHGLYMMSLVARASAEAAGGDARSLKRLAVKFKAPGRPEEELIVKGTVREERDGRFVVDAAAEQGGTEVVGEVEAEVEA